MKTRIFIMILSLGLVSCMNETCTIKNFDGSLLFSGASFDNVYYSEKFKTDDTVILKITSVRETEPSCVCSSEDFYFYELMKSDSLPKNQYDVAGLVGHGDGEDHRTVESQEYYKGILKKHY